MSPYRRAKREDAIKPTKKEMQIKLGSANDSFELLQTKCNDKCVELTKTIELNVGEEMEISFWTADFPTELIGLGTLVKDGYGQITYNLDFSETTL